MGWYDFLNRNPVGKAFSKAASAAIDGVDSVVQKGFDKVDKKINRMSESAQKLGRGIDGIHDTTKRVVRYGLNRNDINEGVSNLKDIVEGAEELKKETKVVLPQKVRTNTSQET